MIIDSYTHITPIRYLKSLRASAGARAEDAIRRLEDIGTRYKQYWDVEARIELLKRYGIDMQAVSVHNIIDPNSSGLRGENLIKLCASVNDEISAICERSRGALIGIGAAPLWSIDDGGADEMRRAVEDLGLKGFMILTNVDGIPADKFGKFWQEADRLSCVVHLHPADPNESSGREYEDEYDMTHVFGWPFETTLILTRLVFSGTLKRNPRVRVVSHHAGGMIPFFAGRISESYSAKTVQIRPDQTSDILASGDPFDDFRSGQIYYDTAVGGNPHAVKCAINVFGHDKMVFATDFPWGPNGGIHRLERYPKIISSLELEEDQLECVFYKNASKLFRLSL
ncbi:MAG: amidohydrolase [Thaumarchaeota archaeon]|nr:amidohydrolase [Candidatus Calditenuaceae archaeon]MDW8042073.1 amidohydrolase family protein [Nitrososphaerota archaeon]